MYEQSLKILNIRHGATSAEIKTAFRKLAAKYHPDKNPGRTRWAEENFKRVHTAYRHVLENRNHYTVYHAKERQNRAEHWWEQRKQSTEPEVRLTAIIRELHRSNIGQAIEMYEDICAKYPDLEMFAFVTGKTRCDLMFLLAEAYESQNAHKKSVQLYKDAYAETKDNKYFRGYAEEIRLKIKNIYCRDIVHDLGHASAIREYRELLDFDLKKTERGYVLKKIAERYQKMGDISSSEHYLTRAYRECPNLNGVLKLLRKLGRSADYFRELAECSP